MMLLPYNLHTHTEWWKERFTQQIYNILEKTYQTFYYVVFVKVCKSYEIKNCLLLWEKELAAAQFKLTKLATTEFVKKLFDLETVYFHKFIMYTVQED